MKTLFPRDLKEALALKAEHPRAVVAAGTTDLLPQWHSGAPKPEVLLVVNRLPELRGIGTDGDVIRIGACATHTEICADETLKRLLPALAHAAWTIGAPAVRNMGTLGGNLGTASPCADLPPALLAYGARVRVASTRGERLIPVHEFFKSYKIIDLAPDELIAEALLPAPPANARCAFAKIGTRRAQSIAKISLGAYCEVEGDRLRNVRLAAGSMGPIHLRLFQAEAAATAGACSRDLIEEAAMKTESDVTPIDDVRSTADYRRVVLGNLVRRFLSEAAGTA